MVELAFTSPADAFSRVAQANLTGAGQKNSISRALPWIIDTYFGSSKGAALSSLTDNLKSFGVLFDFTKGLQKGIVSSMNFSTTIQSAIDLTGAVSGLSKGGKFSSKLGLVDQAYGDRFAKAISVADFVGSAYPFFKPWIEALFATPPTTAREDVTSATAAREEAKPSKKEKEEYILYRGWKHLTQLVTEVRGSFSKDGFTLNEEDQASMLEHIAEVASVVFSISCLVLSSAGLYSMIFSDKKQTLYQTLEKVCSFAYPMLIASEAVKVSASALIKK